MGDGKIEIGVGFKSKGFANDADKIKRKAKEVEDSFSKIGIVAGVAFAGIAAGIGGLVRSAGRVEAITTQFEVLTGSTEQARLTIKRLQDFSAKTPFQFEGIAKAGQQLLGFGFTADELPDKLQRIGDVASASGSDLKDVSLIFGQVAAAGKLTGERLLQFQERAIPIGPALAKSMGVAESSIKKLVSEGKVDFATFEKAFNSLSDEGGKAFKGMEKQSETLEGRLSTLKDNFSLVFVEIGKHFVPIVKKAAIAITEFLQFVRENPKIVKFVAIILAAGAALTGLVAALAAAGIAFVKFSAAMKIAGIATNGLTIGVRALVGATGLGLLIIIATAIFVNWDTVWPRILGTFRAFAQNTTEILGSLGNAFASLLTFDFEGIKVSLSNLKEIFKKSINETIEELSFSHDNIAEGFVGPIQPIADKAKERGDVVKEEIKKTREEIRQLTLEEDAADAELRQERFDGLIEEDQIQRDALFEKRIAERERIQLLTDETELKKELKAQEARTKERQSLVKSIKTKEQLLIATQKKELSRKDAVNLRELEQQRKHGKAVAAIDKFLNTEQVKGAKSASGELVKLQQSKNSKLKAIGKAAAITQIIIGTAESALNIFRGFSTIPILGVPLGIAGAAAAIAFGAEQIQNVTAAAHGGIITGGVSGKDSVPALLTPGELVTPTKNFDEVINAVTNQRLAAAEFEEGERESTFQEVVISMEGEEASQVLTARQNEDRALGISREST